MKTTKLITQKQIADFILANHPEQAKYWLGNGRGKHTPITLKFQCPNCHCEVEIILEKKADLRELLKMTCAHCEELEEAQNQHLNICMPFGKFRGKTINFVMEEQPSYLAWFADNIKGEDKLLELIKTHTGFPQAWAEYVAKQPPKAVREEKEWRQGKFSQQTIDDLCDCLFGEASDDYD